jgi:hypothetical protein
VLSADQTLLSSTEKKRDDKRLGRSAFCALSTASRPDGEGTFKLANLL